jgi:hypothetical protein
MSRGLAGALVVIGTAFAFASPAFAAPPTLTSVGHVQRHPEAYWSLPPGVKAKIAEVATSPATSTDGAFFFENVKAFDLLEDSQTHWIYNFQLDPGTYYVHISGIDEPCFDAGRCPVREYSQIMLLVIAAPPPPPPPPPAPRPRYQASVRSIHSGAIRRPGNWTYVGDTVRARFRNATARPSDGHGYTVCHTTITRRLSCRNRRILSRSWDAFRLRIKLPMVYRAGRSRRSIEFTWRVDRRIVARKRIRIFWDV